MYAHYLANMRRSPGLFDKGRQYKFGIRASYFNGSGAQIHTAFYLLKRVNYKNKHRNVQRDGLDEFVRDHLNEIERCTFRQEIKR